MRGPPSPPTLDLDVDLKTLGVSLGVSRKIRMTMKLDTKIRETKDLRSQVRRLFFRGHGYDRANYFARQGWMSQDGEWNVQAVCIPFLRHRSTKNAKYGK